ncbi:hypothetical protein H072_11172 [Dactylellina haptotyla CBS 200.50]|uniref:REJ domain-containing protein n=1 Tax=Dactylellina haptotyla (strain CBS 200.50) TaxID=1284197 RepID=S7ZYB7_DACHA|nr:hypothetical protein H072_11172 [Dactylellina haptotyla CBS 200.50]
MSTTLSSRLFLFFWVVALYFSVATQAQLTAATGTGSYPAPTNGTPTATLTPPSPTNTETNSAHTQFSSSLALFGALITAAMFSL